MENECEGIFYDDKMCLLDKTTLLLYTRDEEDGMLVPLGYYKDDVLEAVKAQPSKLEQPKKKQKKMKTRRQIVPFNGWDPVENDHCETPPNAYEDVLVVLDALAKRFKKTRETVSGGSSCMLFGECLDLVLCSESFNDGGLDMYSVFLLTPYSNPPLASNLRSILLLGVHERASGFVWLSKCLQ